MPIRINLLAEEQALEDLRRRDPVKRALWGAAAVGVVLVLWYGWNEFKLIQADHELARQQAALDAVDKDAKVSRDALTLSGVLSRKYEATQVMASQRPLWGPMLDALQHCVVTNVSVMHIRTTQNYGYTEAVKAKEGTTIKPKPATMTEVITIVIDARDYGDPNEQNYNKFKEAIAANPFFKERLPNPNDIRLKELSAPTTDPNDATKTYIAFSIECRIPDKVR